MDEIRRGNRERPSKFAGHGGTRTIPSGTRRGFHDGLAGKPAASGDADYLRGWNAATDPLATNRWMTPGKSLDQLSPGSRFPSEAIRRLEASLKTTYVTPDRETYFIQQHVIDLIDKHDNGRLTRGEWDELASRLRFN